MLVTTPQSKGEMYLHGAHVTSWKPAGAEEVLFLSPRSRWQDGLAIRGGVPISFPWFADKADDPHAPAHGFVRTKAWQLESIVQAGDAVTVSMSTESDAETRQWWPCRFSSRTSCDIRLGTEDGACGNQYRRHAAAL